jgi:hypothetical protein
MFHGDPDFEPLCISINIIKRLPEHLPVQHGLSLLLFERHIFELKLFFHLG